MNADPTLDAQFAALADPAYWRGLAPELNVGSAALSAAATQGLDVDTTTLGGLKADLVREGYLQMAPQAWGFDVAKLAAGTSAVVTAGYLPVFTFMYDEAWFMFARLRRMLAGVLDEGYRMMPAFWAWHVDGTREPAGWSPHRDHGHKTLRADRSPKSLTVWLPLTDATPRNGCMYILPADRDAYYGTPRENETPIQLQNVRALPCEAGGVLAWTQAVFHWGGRACLPITHPRISVAVEFQRSDEPPIYPSLLDPMATPDMTLRLRLILRQVLQYQHMYPVPEALRKLAEATALRAGASPAFLQP